MNRYSATKAQRFLRTNAARRRRGRTKARVCLRDAERGLEGGEPRVERLRDRRSPHDGLLADHGPESGRGAGVGHHGGSRFGRQDLIEERAEEIRHEAREHGDAQHGEDGSESRGPVRPEEAEEPPEVAHAGPSGAAAASAATRASAVRPGAPGGPSSSRPRARRARVAAERAGSSR